MCVQAMSHGRNDWKAPLERCDSMKVKHPWNVAMLRKYYYLEDSLLISICLLYLFPLILYMFVMW